MAGHQIHNQIRRLRFEAGELTQQALADKVGVSRQTIITIENGKYCPSLELAFRIAGAFGVDINQVFSYQPGPQAPANGLPAGSTKQEAQS